MVRIALVADAALGVVAALLVLAQAVLLARVAARGFDGASLAAVALPLVLIVVVALARAATVWGFEVVGRRAATDVLSRLRLDVVEQRLSGQPSALDGAESAEVATAAVAGVDALEVTFARYLPQAVLAVVVPVAVLALVASIDLTSAGIMLLTLPLIPVFMWLIGRYTERRTRERWQALALLATHFLDVVRGLPTLRAFNRGQAQTAAIAEITDRYRRTTMGTLRAAFLSGTVLELAATLGIALVAVTVGVRLVDGGIGFESGLTVLVLAPELYLPLRNLAAQFHASADGLAVAERLLDLVEAQPSVASGSKPAPDLRKDTVRLEGISFTVSGPAGNSARFGRARVGPQGDSRARRPERRRQEHDRVSPAASDRAHAGSDSRGEHGPGRMRCGRLACTDRVGSPTADAAAGLGSRQHPARRS